MKQELHLNIQNLHDLLEGASVDDCTASSIKHVTDEIQIAVAQAEGEVPLQGYNEQLEREAIRFSEEHPALTQAIRQVMNTLSNIGI